MNSTVPRRICKRMFVVIIDVKMLKTKIKNV